MTASANAVVLSRALIPLLGVIVWFLVYFDARLAYRMPRGAKRLGFQLSTVVAAILIFVLQVQIMDRLAPADAYGNYFFRFVMIEAGGGLVILFTTLLRERARSMRQKSGTSTSLGRKD